MKKHTAGLQLKSLGEQGNFSGYASVFSILDNQNDMMLPGAFTYALSKGWSDIKLLWQHDFREPIGLFTCIRQDNRGLYVEGKLLLDIRRAREAYSLLKAGAIAGLSIGYAPVKYRADPETGARLLEEVALYEISVVTFPANPQAHIRAVKQDSGEWNPLIAELDRAVSILHYQ